MKTWPALYRVHDTITEDGLRLYWQEWVVVGETPKCWYVNRSGHVPQGVPVHKLKYVKRVLKSQDGRRYCYSDKTEALRSYLIRKQWQATHAKRAMITAEAGRLAALQLLGWKDGPELPYTLQTQDLKELTSYWEF